MRKVILLSVIVLTLGFCSSAYAVNYALQFDGSNDFVAVPDRSSLDLSTGMTIEAWIKSSSTAGARVIAAKWDDRIGQWSYIFKDHNTSDKLRIELSPGGYWTRSDLEGNTSIATDSWIHVAATYDSNVIKLYYNGVAEPNYTSWTAPINNSTSELFIGNVNGNETFSGLIDEVRIWNYARTPQQLQDWKNYSLTGNEAGLVGYWNFDEGTGQTVRDLTQYANNGMLGANSNDNGDIYDPQWVPSNGLYGQSGSVVPEPASLSLFGLGLLGLVFRRKRKV